MYFIDLMTLIMYLFGLQIVKELQSLKQISGPDPNYNDLCFSGAGKYVCLLHYLIVHATLLIAA